MKYKYRRYYLYYLTKISFFLVNLLPRRIALRLAEFAGRMAFLMLTRYRNTAVSNLNAAFGNDRAGNLKITEGVFKNISKNAVECIKLSFASKEELHSLVTEVHGIENLDRSLSRGKGALVLASHFGNWEMLSIYIKSRGYEGSVIGRRIYFHKYDKLLRRLRERFGVYAIYRDSSPKKMLSVLKKGAILGILGDQDIDSVESVFVDFFGRPAYTPVAPVKLGMVTGADLIPAFMIRKPDDTYKLVFEEPITVSSGTRSREDVLKYTQAWTDVLERYVREYPEQWVWLHERWKTQPEAV